MTEDFSRYRAIVSDLSTVALGAGVSSSPEDASEGPRPVMMAAAAAKLLLRDDAALYPLLMEGFKTLAALGRSRSATGLIPRLADPAGHVCEVYHPLALHLHLAAFARRFESMPPHTWAACEDALPEATIPVRDVENYADVPPPSDQTAVVLWQALCLIEQAILAGRDVDLELADSILHQVVSQPSQGGSLHWREEPESLDGWTFRELCGLHALANVALRRRNANWAKRVEKAARYHLANSQPDNMTNQPWAVFAFLWSPNTRSFAEQQLHDTTAHLSQSKTTGQAAVAGLLLADAADALGAFES